MVENSTVEEGDMLTFQVSMDKLVDTDVTIFYSTTDGSARASDSDFVPAENMTVVIPAGQNSTTITIPTLEDGLVEGDEWLHLHFVGDAVGRPITGTGYASLGTIEDDDMAILSVANSSADEGEYLEFTASLSHPVDTDVQVYFYTQDGTARVGDSDYVPRYNVSMRIEAGDQSAKFYVRSSSDPYHEEDEVFYLLYSVDSDGRAVTRASTSAIGTIVNNDSEWENGGDTTERERRRRRRLWWWW